MVDLSSALAPHGHNAFKWAASHPILWNHLAIPENDYKYLYMYMYLRKHDRALKLSNQSSFAAPSSLSCV